MINNIQKQLAESYPEFNHHRELIEYYVSFQFPEKQRKMLLWWGEVIEAAVRFSGELQLSPLELETIFTVDRLKPVPLSNILKHLHAEEKIQWKGKPPKKGWFSGMMGYMLGSQDKTPLSNSEKIVPNNYKNKQKQATLKMIQINLEMQRITDYTSFFEVMQAQLKLSNQAINMLLLEISEEGIVGLDEIEGRKVILYYGSKRNQEQVLWKDAEKCKYILRKKIQLLENKIDMKIKQEEICLKNAKEIAGTNKTKARQILEKVKSIRRLIAEITNRKKYLEGTYNQLELQEADNLTFATIRQAQDVIKKTMTDPSQLEEIQSTHQQIVINQKELNEQLEEMNRGQIDEVDKLLQNLENQLEKNKMERSKLATKREVNQKQNKKLIAELDMDIE